jgi:hypothetical protein
MSKAFNIIKTVFITAVMVGLFLLFAYQQTHYVRVGHVVCTRQFAINYYYTFTDSTGNGYEFISTEQIDPNAVVKVIMFDNCTEENIKDDMIIDYKVISKNEKEK